VLIALKYMIMKGLRKGDTRPTEHSLHILQIKRTPCMQTSYSACHLQVALVLYAVQHQYVNRYVEGHGKVVRCS
jgi:hypothetical protein